jgi:hypothetical protein
MFDTVVSGYRIELDYSDYAELSYTLTAFNPQGDLIAAICDKYCDNAIFKLELLMLEWDI